MPALKDDTGSIAQFASLNDAQMDAVQTLDGPLLVLAGAGTGKTKVLTCRIANLLMQGVFPSEILAVTFTNKAAKEMLLRVQDMVSERANGIWLGTFHSIAAKILRTHAETIGLKSSFTIIDTDDQIKLLKQALTEQNIDEKRWPAKQLAAIINSWKDKGLTPEQISPNEYVSFLDDREKTVQLYRQYQQRLLTLNAVDFGDLLLHNLTIFQKNPEILSQYQRRFRYVLVDEYQDTNVSQYLWLHLLSQTHKNICCVGDDDQSIYGWRGAEVGNILRFEKDFSNAKVIRLERNYRSTSHILSAASGLIAHNKSRLGKTLWTEGNSGKPVRFISTWDDQEEARFISEEIESLQQLKDHSLHEFAILVRAGFQTRTFEEALISYQIPYRVIGGLRFYERMEIRDVIAYLRLCNQLEDGLAFERIVNTPKRGIGDSTLQQIRSHSRTNATAYFESTEQLLEQQALKPKVANALTNFCQLTRRWNKLSKDLPLRELTEVILDESGYLSMWKNDTAPDAQSRIENIKELLHALEEFESITDFLEHVSLVTDIDSLDQEQMVNIMTLHSAKGLEFDTVFLAGWEEGLFPHQRSLDDSGTRGLEEERRLAYVGLTRAKKQAYILAAANRRIYGQYQNSIPSRFIDELPQENIERQHMGSAFAYKQSNNTQKKVTPKIESENANPFSLGKKVQHKKFGQGTIVSVRDDGQLDIVFNTAGLKRILKDFVTPA
jgi:DNA helicase-2/ATP-dependent DNA helicase PcrA